MGAVSLKAGEDGLVDHPVEWLVLHLSALHCYQGRMHDVYSLELCDSA